MTKCVPNQHIYAPVNALPQSDGGMGNPGDSNERYYFMEDSEVRHIPWGF